MLDRRRFLHGLSAFGAVGLLPRLGAAAPSLSAGPRATNLVLLELAGGNDGLSTVVPHGDDAYGRARRKTRIGADEVLPLDAYRGLHPELKHLHRHFDEGRLAIVQGVGYPGPKRSHFKAMDVWHAGDLRGRLVPEGWVGRLCQCTFGAERDPGRVVHIGEALPYSLHSARHPATAFANPDGFRWVGNEEVVGHVDERLTKRLKKRASGGTGGAREPDVLAELRATASNARRTSLAVRKAVHRYKTKVDYPKGDFGDALHAAAALLQGELGCRIVSLQLNGFDTHADQRRRHDRLMASLDAGLGALLEDLARTKQGKRTVVLVYSEFGRRVAENGGQGTDHGVAGPVLVGGHAVDGGLYGEHPSLEDLQDGDLVHTVDFRSVYGELIEGCFGTDMDRVLGERFPKLALLS